MRNFKALFCFIIIFIIGISLFGCDAFFSQGKSAYDLAVENGFVGTVEEWLESLKGKDGEYSGQGKSAYELALENGFNGTITEWLESLKGKDGKDGEDGDSAYEIAVENGFNGTITEWLESLNGEDGENGTNGLNGENGEDITAESLFNKAVSFGLYENTNEGYQQFLSDYLNEVMTNINLVQEVSSKCLNQVVSIYCENNDGVLQAGAGVFYKIDRTNNYAYIITNYHVVSCSETITTGIGYNSNSTNYYEAEVINCYLYGCESLFYNSDNSVNYGNNAIDATYIGGSAVYDLAVLKVEGDSFNIIKNSSAQPISFEDTNNIQLGSTAIAIGNPMASGTAVTTGIVSCDSEYVNVSIAGGSRKVRCIRIDSAVNGGNSGGGLFNAEGKLIGIVNAKKTNYISDGEPVIYENVGYAIAGSNVKEVVENIVYFYEIGYSQQNEDNTVGVHKFLVGITVTVDNTRNTYNEILKTNTLEEDTVVSMINENSIASGIGMEVGDKITKLTIIRAGESTTYNISRQFILLDKMLSLRNGDVFYFTIERFNENTTEYEEIVLNGISQKINVTLSGFTEL